MTYYPMCSWIEGSQPKSNRCESIVGKWRVDREVEILPATENSEY
jgi:hypothetical protein